MKTRILTQSQVRDLLSMDQVVPAIEKAFRAHARGETLMPSKVFLDLESYDGDFQAMPAYLAGSAGVKWVSLHPKNPERFGLPAVLAVYVLTDPTTAQTLAILDATWLTAVRTGAAAAVASKHLADPKPQSIGFVGCGVQARTMLEALRVVYPEVEVLAADRSQTAAERLADAAGGRVVPIHEAAGAAIVCTATPAREPVIRANWISPGAHINAMGADAPGKQELDSEVLERALIVVDDYEQAIDGGEVNVPLHERLLSVDDIHGTLGEVITGRCSGRSDENEITLFDSTGLAVQDVAVARLVYDEAEKQEVGNLVDLTA